MNTNHEANWDRLIEFVPGLMKEKGVPGVAVGISHKGKTAAAGFGVTNVDHPLPVTDETLFQIGSITKTFTGTAVLRLVEMCEKTEIVRKADGSIGWLRAGGRIHPRVA
jgi:CubicO group peptidase (beta-lactamase class C family)